MSQCYSVDPKTKEYKTDPSAKSKCLLPLSREGSPCAHGRVGDTFYPGFHIPGLSEPFAILVEVCSICARKLAKDEVLTDERWERMKAILTAHGVKLIPRDNLRMVMVKAVHENPFSPWHVYTMAA